MYDKTALEMAMHFARTSPERESVPCPKCGDDLEHLWEWERAAGDKEPPLVCARPV